MKFYTDNSSTKLPDELKNLLNIYRRNRNFQVDQYIKNKTTLLNTYFKTYSLDTAVIGVSGGIDSALVLSLTVKASQLPGSPIKRILPILLPAFGDEGATNQAKITAQGENLCRHYDLQPLVFTKLAELSSMLIAEMERLLGVNSQEWAKGQLVAYQRTPALYYATTLSTESGHPAVVVGTTNLDEGGYLGYIGKASDGMVDLQIISDLHKSEVYQVAEALGVTPEILQAVPSGDMYDGRVDEEVFGASYEFVELYLGYLASSKREQEDINQMLSECSPETIVIFEKMRENLEALHSYNHHKYLGKSPAVHLDILPAQIPGGWENLPWTPPTNKEKRVK